MNNLFRSFLLVLLLSAGFCSFGQNVKCTTYYAVSNRFNAIAIEGDTIWAGTDCGVLKLLTTGELLKRLTQSDGLIYNEIRSIVIDAEGNKWFFTSIGVSKFDGIKWTTYKSNDFYWGGANIGTMAVEENGTLWCGTWNGAITFNGNKWAKYTTVDGLVDNNINSVTIDNAGNKWFVTDQGVSRFNDTSWTTYHNTDVRLWDRATTDNDGNVWLCNSNGLAKYDGSNWINSNYTIANGIYSFANDSDNNKWIGAVNSVYQYNGTDWKKYTTADGLAGTVISIAFDADGNKWFGTDKGLSKFDGSNWSTYTVESGLVNNSVAAITVDTLGNKWFGTSNGDVSKFDGVKWTSYKRVINPYAKFIFSASVDQLNNVWFAAYDGVFKYDGDKRTNYTTADGLPTNFVNCVISDIDNNKWFGTQSEGVVKYDGNNWTTYNKMNGLSDNKVYNIAEDNNGNIWFATDKGVSKFDGQFWETFSNEADFTGDSVIAVATDIIGNVWFGSTHGVTRYDGNKWKTYTEADGLADNYVHQIATDTDGNVWFTTGRGLSKFDGATWTNYTTANGLPENYISSIAIDAEGVKWFVAGRGVSKLEDGGAGPYKPGKYFRRGTVYYDKNKNGQQDNGEYLIGNQYLQMQPTGAIIGNFDGKFSFYRKDGHYTLSLMPDKNWEATSAGSVEFDVKNGKTQTVLTFGVAPKAEITDFSADLIGRATRASFNTRYWLNATNIGTAESSSRLTMEFSPLLTFQSASVEPTKITANTIEWDIAAINVFDRQQIAVDFRVAGVDHLGDTIKNTVTISPDMADANMSNNSMALAQVITGSYDPNDKRESTGVMSKGYTLFGQELDYTIRFQNTGTDTAFTVNITDTLHSLLDYTSFKLQSSSHACTFALDEKGVVKFTFKNILLPDNKKNELASNGYVEFSIKPKAGMAENTEIKNTGYIYFDFNPAIVTNTALNTFVSVIPADADKDGYADRDDFAPNDPSESCDTDKDGIGDNADAFPKDANESVDSDKDGVGNNADAFPNNPSETKDSDKDGVGDNADAFPKDPEKWEVGVTLKHANDQLVLTPNPAKNRLCVSGTKSGDYMVSNADGQIIARGQMTDGQIDVSMLPAGNYILQIGSNTAQFIKE